MTEKEEGQPLSQDGWPLLLLRSAEAVIIPKEAGWSALRVLWQKPETYWRLSEPRRNPGGATGGAQGPRRR